VIVVDTNLIAYLLIEGARTPQAETVLARDPEWAAPLLWRSEFRNVLTFYIRRRVLSLAEAVDKMGKAELLMQGKEYEVSSVQVLTLAAGSRRSAYDCEFLTLAQDLGVPLVTADRGVLSDFPAVSVSVDDFAS
jgi:predicted nucleic acid-binding protein